MRVGGVGGREVKRGLVWEGAPCEGKEQHVFNLALANHVSFVLSDDRKSHHKQAGCLCYVYASKHDMTGKLPHKLAQCKCEPIRVVCRWL